MIDTKKFGQTVLLWGINVQAFLKVNVCDDDDWSPLSSLDWFSHLQAFLLQMTVEQVKRFSLVNSTISQLPHQGFFRH